MATPGDVDTDQSKRETKVLDIAVDTRKFEIGLFWQRSLFFWGFIGAAFIAYGAAMSKQAVAGAAPGTALDQTFPLIISCFGFVCSVIWSLANRASKYWQEAWEQKLRSAQQAALKEDLFGYHPAPKKLHFWGSWSMRWHFSVSKLTIALSDFTVFIWLALLAKAARWKACLPLIDWHTVLPLGSIAYLIIVLLGARSANEPLEATPRE